MTFEEIGQKVKSKYPQYGHLSDNEVGQKVVAKYPEYKKQLSGGDAYTATHPNEDVLTGAIGKTGAFDIPVLGRLLRSAVQPLASYGAMETERMTAPFRQAAIKGASKSGQQLPSWVQSDPNKPQFMGGESYGKTFGPQATPLSSAAEQVGTGLGAAADVATLMDFIPSGAKYLAPKAGTAARLAGKAVTAPTKGMVAGRMSQVTKEAENVGSKVGGQAIRDQVENIIKETPTMSEEKVSAMRDFADKIAPKIGVRPNKEIVSDVLPTKVLKYRQDLLKEYGPSLLDWFTGTSSKKQAASEVRNILSEQLKKEVPNIKDWDKLYSLYSKGGKFGGSPAKLATKYGIPLILAEILGPKLAHSLGVLVSGAVTP